MCGVIGILGNKPVALSLLESLKRLEYRGYDSAGIATLENNNINRVRSTGKLFNLENKLKNNDLKGLIGIGHTRWATHGEPSETNAHPHQANNIAIVHNGIIENFKELKNELESAGVKLETQTDTETVVQLISLKLSHGLALRQAIMETMAQIVGTFAFIIMVEGEENLLVGTRRGSPLAIGYGNGEMFLGSDATALTPLTTKISYLEDDDIAFITRDKVEIIDKEQNHVDRDIKYIQAANFIADKGSYRHFMAKEIAEQPEVVGHALAEYLNLAKRCLDFPDHLKYDFSDIERINIVACGTAYYAGMVGKYWLEKIACLPVDIDIASEFRYREAPLHDKGVTIVISQSGETADTLAALRYCKNKGQKVIGIVNVQESSIAREADIVFPTYAGPEIGVASTKAFMCQITVIAILSIFAGKQKNVVDKEMEEELVSALIAAPRHLSTLLHKDPEIEQISRLIANHEYVLYLGRGINYPIALEGALKLKEISYIHAEGYAAGELKHGPIALIDEDVPVIVIAPHDGLFEKTVSNMQEVRARGGKVIFITDDKGSSKGGEDVFQTIKIPQAHQFINPLLYVLPIQLLAYHAAVFMGTDIDQPRNLAKSVTVE